ncbi:DUF2524 family protein [Evansella cellulosilytica]|uniref:Golgi autoantigen, golgin subfamily b, macrogolgin (With transmembrane signal), 1 n=1 Tax=Evansella cellulosilytica (strain ATCC 21833 / DSM 2522 / FERM P-1141 / JCM 9156 / N-4) TaxID=649639 RepID=E6U0K7_EVAC2|nr:DUF2524 family protein [Evansella cellulosilytica]ADU31452.1 golgi autoantigen, golgin subfamily b, macrogolgin (with transmembrane signal), 1 [Evansella cellulosilytica DSM 2522]
MNTSITHYMMNVKETVEEAQKELLDIKIIREYDPTEYSYAFKQLKELEEEASVLLETATPEEQVAIREARDLVLYTQEVMTRGI